MLNEHAQELVAALRSGEYTQTSGKLHGKAGFCCLGVACDLYIKAHPNEEGWIADEDGLFGMRTEENQDGAAYIERALMPARVRDWFRFGRNDGAWDNTKESLTATNDSGATFDDIAEIIESDPEGLFA